MAPRLFPRNPKRPPDTTPGPEVDADADSQLFSKDLAFGHVPVGETAPDQMAAPAIPSLQSQDHQQPGWYPDTTDPGLMRYWDGFHFTGQAKRASPDEPSNGQAQAGVSVTASLTAEAPSIGSEDESTDVDAVVQSLLGPSVAASPFVGDVATAGSDTREATPFQIPPSTGPTTYLPLVVIDSARSPEASVSVGADTPAQKPPAAPKPPAEGVRQAPGEPEAEVEAEVIETPAVVAADNDSVATRDGQRGSEMSDSPHSEGVADGVSNWGKDAELAVSRALSVDTPEAWEAAAHVAAVVSEMARTMQSVADAKQTARETAKVAEEAAEVARVAAKTASDATETAEQMAKAADDAAEAAQVAARKAIEAKETAERTALAAPKAEETASAASQAAADAKHKAETLEQLVASARTANTPSAWSEALKQSAIATEAEKPVAGQLVAEQPVAEASTERVPGSAPSPALWKRSTPVGGPKDPSSEGGDVLSELGPAPVLAPAPEGASGSQFFEKS